MKKLVFMLIAMLSVTLTSCSWFDSAPIEPKILGVSNLHYDAQSGTYSVMIDSNQYTISQVTIPENDPHSMGVTQDIAPIEGMQVTVFTSPRMHGIQAVSGKQSVTDIENLYHTNSTGVMIYVVLFIVCIIGIGYKEYRKVPVVKADA